MIRLVILLLITVSWTQAIDLQTIPVIRSSTEPIHPASSLSFPFETNKDLLITISNVDLVSYKLGTDGFYHFVDTRPLTYPDSETTTVTIVDGWVALAANPIHEIFAIDANGTFGNKTYQLAMYTEFGWLFSDATYVVLLPDGIHTYEFNGTAWAQIRAELPNGYSWTNFASRLPAKRQNYITNFYGNLLEIFVRKEDRSWTKFTSLSVPTSVVYSTYIQIAFDGIDTLVIGSVPAGTPTPPYGYGAVTVMQRVSDSWQQMQQFTAGDLELTGSAQLGNKLVQYDANNIAVGALDGVGDSIWWLQRDPAGGEWSFTKRFQVRTQPALLANFAPLGPDGLVALECEQDAVSTVRCFFSIANLCFVDPTNVTCHDQQTGSCSTLDLDLSSLYTINTPAKCGPVAAEYSSVKSGTDGLQIGLKFVRDQVADVTCSVTIACDQSTRAPSAVTGPGQASLASRAGWLGLSLFLFIGLFIIV